jgi:hypothetical protein
MERERNQGFPFQSMKTLVTLRCTKAPCEILRQAVQWKNRMALS